VNQPINPPICGSDPAAFIVACGTLRAGVRRQLQRPQPLSDPLCYIWRKRFEFTLRRTVDDNRVRQ
jgi:hypothetical protein